MKSKLPLKHSVLLAIALAVMSSVSAQTTAPPATAASASAGMQMSGDMTHGEVRKVDRENKKITLKHGEIKNLGMPSMTMVFQVKEPAMLEKLKEGDTVMFTAEKVNGAMTVTSIEPTK